MLVLCRFPLFIQKFWTYSKLLIIIFVFFYITWFHKQKNFLPGIPVWILKFEKKINKGYELSTLGLAYWALFRHVQHVQLLMGKTILWVPQFWQQKSKIELGKFFCWRKNIANSKIMLIFLWIFFMKFAVDQWFHIAILW